MSLRATNRLRARGVWTVAQLLQVAAPGTALRRTLGPDLGNEIDIALRKYGYTPPGDASRATDGQSRTRTPGPTRGNGRQKESGAPVRRTVNALPNRREALTTTAVREESSAKRSSAPLGPSWQPTKNEVRLYRVEDRWVVRLEVTAKMLRGAGRALPAAVGSAIGCRPGSAMWHFRTRVDGLVVTWPEDRPSGPYLGSIDRDLRALGACEGDLVFLKFHGQSVSLDVLRADELRRLPAAEQVARLVGSRECPVEHTDLWRLVAVAIGMPVSQGDASAESIYSCLMRRGEVGLSALVRQAAVKPRSILDELEGVLGL